MPVDRDQATILDIVTAGRLILEFKRGLDYLAPLAPRPEP
jgi:hypothetical protein